MGWIKFEALLVFCPGGTDVFVRCEPFEGLESSAEVVDIDEVGEMLSEVLVGLVIKRLTVASLRVRFMRSTWPLVQGCFGLVRRWSMFALAQANSKA